MQQHDKLQEEERTNHFNIFGRPANLNDRTLVCQKYQKKLPQALIIVDIASKNSPKSNRKVLLKPLSKQLVKRNDEVLLQYFPSTTYIKRNKKLAPILIEQQSETLKSVEQRESHTLSSHVKKKDDLQQQTVQLRAKTDSQRFKPNQKDQKFISNQECDKIQNLLRYNMATLLKLIDKREYFFDKMIKEDCPQDTEIVSFSSQQTKEIQENLIKIVRFLQNKSRYKYRSIIQIQKMPQLQILQYTLKKNEKQLAPQTKKHQDMDDDDDSPIQKKKNNSPFQKKRKVKIQIPALDFQSWKQINQIDQKTKIFIIKGGYQDLRDDLLDRGWMENTDVYSSYYDFKWTCKIQDLNFDTQTDNQIVNHFDQNQTLTSKYGLCRNIRSLSWSEPINVNQFYPRCYDLGDSHDFQDFIEDFKLTQCYSILNQFILDEIILNDSNKLRVRLSIKIIQRNDINLLQQLGMIFFRDSCPFVQRSEWIMLQKEADTITDKSHEELINLYLLRNGITEVLDVDEFKEVYLPIAKNLLIPKNQDNQFALNGPRNIWIVKPDFSSRGRGIRCFNKLNKILNHVLMKETSFVVQKYIEYPLIIKGRKFDIRQWVLVQELHPPKIWFFKECYVRFSAEEFELDNLQNRYVHLTNNSIAKHSLQFNKSDIKGNMWTQDQFISYLKEQSGQEDLFYSKIQPRFKEIINYTVKCCSDLMRGKKKSFEIFGYDFMIDSQLNVWLIEINSSPAMDHSTQITADLVPILLQDTIKVLLDNKKNKKKVGYFQLICGGEQDQNQEIL